MPELHGEYTDRGFFHMDPVETSYGAIVKIYQSSNVIPSIWLRINQPPPKYGGQLPEAEAVAHMHLHEAELIHAQLGHLIDKAKEHANG